MNPGALSWVLAGVILVPGLWLAVLYNRLVRLQNRLREAWSGVDVQLKRRHDLIPNLVECVKGYRDHEQNVLAAVAQSRSLARAADDVPGIRAAEHQLTQNLRALLAVAEAWPALKADQNFRQLSATLIAVEDDLQHARRYYNGSVRDFNNLVQTFPGLLVARCFHFKPVDYFELETATERTVPEVGL
jgi:LemA protein